MSIRFSGSLLCGGLLLSALSPAIAQPAPPVVGACSPTKIKFAAASITTMTTSSSFVNLPQTAINFTQGGSSPSCVIVRFSAMAYASGTNIIVLRAMLDNTTAGLPENIQFASSDGVNAQARSYEFIFPSVAPGSHTIRIQHRNNGGTDIGMHKYNTIVEYAP